MCTVTHTALSTLSPLAEHEACHSDWGTKYSQKMPDFCLQGFASSQGHGASVCKVLLVRIGSTRYACTTATCLLKYIQRRARSAETQSMIQEYQQLISQTEFPWMHKLPYFPMLCVLVPVHLVMPFKALQSPADLQTLFHIPTKSAEHSG